MYEKHLKSAARSGVYHLSQTHHDSLKQAADKLGLPVLVADLSACRKVTEALRQIGTALHFPTWYGANLDALFDCLTDPDGQAGKASVLLLNGIDNLQQAEPENFSTLLEVFQAVAEARRETGNPCWILLDTPTRGIAALPAA